MGLDRNIMISTQSLLRFQILNVFREESEKCRVDNESARKKIEQESYQRLQDAEKEYHLSVSKIEDNFWRDKGQKYSSKISVLEEDLQKSHLKKLNVTKELTDIEVF